MSQLEKTDKKIIFEQCKLDLSEILLLLDDCNISCQNTQKQRDDELEKLQKKYNEDKKDYSGQITPDYHDQIKKENQLRQLRINYLTSLAESYNDCKKSLDQYWELYYNKSKKYFISLGVKPSSFKKYKERPAK